MGLGFSTWNNVGWDCGLGNSGVGLGLGSFGKLRFILAGRFRFLVVGSGWLLIGLGLATVGVGGGLA